jgi:hypothetical protein
MTPNKSLHRTAPAPSVVMPVAISEHSLVERQAKIRYHVLCLGLPATVMPTLGSGSAGELRRSADRSNIEFSRPQSCSHSMHVSPCLPGQAALRGQP